MITDTDQTLEAVKTGKVEEVADLASMDKSERDELLWEDSCGFAIPDPNGMDKFIEANIMHVAAYYGQDKIIPILSKFEIPTDLKDIHGDTPLHYATRGNHVKTIRALVEAGAGVNEKNRVRDCPLHLAARAGHKEAVKALLALEADTEKENADGFTPIKCATAAGKTQVVLMLLEKYPEDDSKKFLLDNLLGIAARYGRNELCRAFISEDATLNYRDGVYAPPVYKAALEGHEETVKILLEQGATLEFTAKNGSTALSHALGGGNFAIIRMFYDAGARNFGPAPNFYINNYVIDHRPSEVDPQEAGSRLKTLLEELMKERDEELVTAAREGNTGAVNKLVKAGANRTLLDEELHVAAQEGNTEMVEKLVKAGANKVLPKVYSKLQKKLHEYDQLTHNEDGAVNKVRKIFDNYRKTLGGTTLRRFFTGRWNKNENYFATEIVNYIDSNPAITYEKLKEWMLGKYPFSDASNAFLIHLLFATQYVSGKRHTNWSNEQKSKSSYDAIANKCGSNQEAVANLHWHNAHPGYGVPVVGWFLHLRRHPENMNASAAIYRELKANPDLSDKRIQEITAEKTKEHIQDPTHINPTGDFQRVTDYVNDFVCGKGK